MGAPGSNLDPLIKSQLLRHTYCERTRSRKHVKKMMVSSSLLFEELVVMELKINHRLPTLIRKFLFPYQYSGLILFHSGRC